MKNTKLPRISSTLYKWILIVIFSFVLNTISLGQSTNNSPLPQWYVMNSTEGGFSVKFPNKPTHKVDSMKIANIEIPTHTYYLGNKDTSFGICYMDAPAGSNIEAGFEGTISSLSRSVTSKGGKITYQNDINYKGCQGKEIIGSDPTLPYFHARVFSSGLRFYIILCGFSSKSPNTEEMAKNFFNSLEIIDGCSGGVAVTESPTEEITESSIEGIEDPETKWKKLSISEDLFSILMPNTTKLFKEQIQVDPFPLYLHTYTSSMKNLKCSILVIGEYPNNVYSDENSYQVALDVAYSSVKKIFHTEGSTIEFIRNLRIGKFPGREYLYLSKNQVGKLQTFITPKKLYIFSVLQEEVNNGNFDTFFKSIRISVK